MMLPLVSILASMRLASGYMAGSPTAPTVARTGAVVALAAEQKVARNALMHRSVAQQLTAFAVVHETTQQQYLAQQWSTFLEYAGKQQQQRSAFELTHFVSHLYSSEATSVFVPKRQQFRGLSPGNPYLAAQQPGSYEEVRPTAIALRLMSCREQLAVDWLELMPEALAAMTTTRERNDTAPAAAVGECATAVSGRDKQLLLGIATKLATRQMLAELSLRPSTRHLHDWLASYVLVQHAADLTATGSVARLHANLAAQPMCLRGGALVDPLSLSIELFERSALILEAIEEDLQSAPHHVVPLTAGFLESCLLL